MTYQNYEFTAFAESDLTSGNIKCGVSFTMPGTATTCITVSDNDSFLSGDNKCNENANDHSGQHASIEGPNGELGNGGQIYAEVYHWVCDQHGNWYVMIEIEQEGTGDDYFTFYTGHGYTVPPEGAELTVGSKCNVTSNWIDFKCLDAGEKEPEPGCIYGRLTLDADCNNNEWNEETGAWDEGVAGQTVQLIDLDGNVVAETTTDGYGSYSFMIAPGEYKVKFPEIEGFEFAEKGVGGWHYDSDANANGVTDVITVTSGADVSNIDASIKEATGSISGRVFCDTDCDGIDGGTTIEKGPNLVVNGDFENYPDLQYGSWGLFDSIEGWYAIKDKIEIQEGSHGTGNAAGNAVVELDANNNAIICQQVHVDTAGTYCFSIDYAMRGNDAGTNGFAVYINGVKQAEIFPTESGFQTLEFDIDLGVGTTRIDLKGLGDSDCIGTVVDNVSLSRLIETTVEEPGKEGVTVKLVDLDGNVVDTTTTDADGNYEFATVPKGDYKIMVVNPDGTEFTLQNEGDNDAIDSDVDASGMSGVISVGGGDNITDVDAGLKDAPLGSLSGRYFCDDDGDDTENDGNGGFDVGVAGATVWLLDAGGNIVGTTTTDSNGGYRFDDLEAGDYRVRFEDPNDVAGAEGKTFVAANQGAEGEDSDVESVGGAGNGNTGLVSVVAGEETRNVDAGIADPGTAAIEGRVFCDSDDDNDDNNNGDEAGVGGVTVELLDADGNVVATQDTGADGSYSFTGLDAGTYSVRFPSSVDGKTLVDANSGASDLSDSDAVDNGDGTASTGPITVAIGETSSDNDAGIEDPGTAAIEGRYFCDDNGDDVDNGNGGEPGISGATVELLDAGGNVVDTTTTDGNGDYSFTGLDAGTYSVRFAPDSEGKTFVAQDDPNGNGDDTNDSDVDGSGQTGPITVGIGETSSDNDAGVEDPGTAALKGRVFEDTDDDNDDNGNGGEPAVADVTVELLDADGNVIDTTTTDDMGNYEFTGLKAGDYSVRFPSTVGDLTLIDPNAGASDASDSDAVDNGDGTAQTGTISLAIGEVSVDNDAGLENTNENPTPDADAFMTCADEVATFDLLANDTDPNGDTLSVVSIMDEDEMAGVGESITLESGAVVTLNADGTVTYDGVAALAELQIGDTAVDEFKYTVEDGKGGSASADVETTACGALNTVETISASLPTIGCATYFFPATADESFGVTIEGTGALGEMQADGSIGLDGSYDGWCIDFNGEVVYDVKQNGTFYSSTDADDLAELAANGLVENIDKLDEINWILNNQDTILANADYDVLDVQNAIWALTDPSSFTAEAGSDAEEIAMMAMDNDGFEAGPGGVYGVVFAPTDLVDGERGQTFIIAVPWDELEQDCIC